jgi:hypothetical membrane protein
VDGTVIRVSALTMSRRTGSIAVLGPIAGLGFLLALHLLPGHLDPARWPVSDYALQRNGGLLALAFISFAVGELALARGVRALTAARAGALLLSLSALGMLGVAIFHVPRSGAPWSVARAEASAHVLSAWVAFYVLTAAMLVLARRLEPLGIPARASRGMAIGSLVLGWLSWRVPLDQQGAWERVYLGVLFAWLLWGGAAVWRAARGARMRRPASAPSAPRTSAT